MKKILSAVLVCILMLGCVFALASCGGGIPAGEYTAEGQEGIVNKIDGDKWIMEGEITDGLKVKMTYTYELKDDEITMTFEKLELVEGDEEMFNQIKASMEEGLESEEMSGVYEKTDKGFNVTVDGYTTKYIKK